MTARHARALSAATFLAALATTCVTSEARAQGLAPPPPMNPNQPGAPNAAPNAPGGSSDQATRARLDEAEGEDSGRAFELFWLRGDVGGGYTNLTGLSEDSLQLKETSGGGPAFGVAAGVRFVLLVVGARLRYNTFSPFNLWQINAELGLKFPVGSFDFLVGGHGGFAFVGSLGDAALATDPSLPKNSDKVNVRGFNAGLDLAGDYYITSIFSVGAGVFGDLLFLNRPVPEKPDGFAQLTPAQQAQLANDPLYQRSGSSAGYQIGGGLRVGLHLGL